MTVIRSNATQCMYDARKIIAEAIPFAVAEGKFNLASRLVYLCEQIKLAPETKERGEK